MLHSNLGMCCRHRTFHGTIKENLLYGKLDATEEENFGPAGWRTCTISLRKWKKVMTLR